MAQVVTDQVRHPLPSRSAPLEPPQYLLGDFGASLRVAVKSEPAVLPPDTNRLADIMQKATIGQSLGRGIQIAECAHRMDENIAFGMVIRTLLDAFHRLDFR